MREFLFRGKTKPGWVTKDGVWVEGSYVRQSQFYGDPVDRHWILIVGEFDCDEYDAKLILPETLGQFTGFYDYNGKKIFEGDILDRRVPRKNWSNRMYVAECRGSYVLWDYEDNEDFLSNWCNTSYRNNIDVGGCYVIGNIHDNPELLGKVI